MVRAIASATSSGSATLASSTNQTVANSRQQVGRGLHGEPGLADPTDAGEGDDPVLAESARSTRATSSSRPTSDERWAGRLLA